MQRATHLAAATAVSVIVGAAVLMIGCMPSLSRREVASYKRRTLYTCCNIHFDSWDVNDVNYHVGSVLALGTPVQVESVGHRNVWIKAGSGELRLSQDYGRDQESFSSIWIRSSWRTIPRCAWRASRRMCSRPSVRVAWSVG